MSVNFTGNLNISYKTPNEFRKLVRETNPIEVCRRPHYRFSDSVTSIDRPMVTTDSNSCMVLVLNDTMFHLAPELEELNLLQKLTDFAKSIKDKTGDLTAFIFGARASRIQKNSYKLCEDTRNMLVKQNADMSAIYGKRIDGFLDDLYKDKNNLTFTQRGNIGLEEMSQEKDITPERLKELFTYYYDTVEISPKHKIVIT